MGTRLDRRGDASPWWGWHLETSQHHQPGLFGAAFAGPAVTLHVPDGYAPVPPKWETGVVGAVSPSSEASKEARTCTRATSQWEAAPSAETSVCGEVSTTLLLPSG